MNKPILDACCGAKIFHFDRSNPLVLFMDNHIACQRLDDVENENFFDQEVKVAKP